MQPGKVAVIIRKVRTKKNSCRLHLQHHTNTAYPTTSRATSVYIIRGQTQPIPQQAEQPLFTLSEALHLPTSDLWSLTCTHLRHNIELSLNLSRFPTFIKQSICSNNCLFYRSEASSTSCSLQFQPLHIFCNKFSINKVQQNLFINSK